MIIIIHFITDNLLLGKIIEVDVNCIVGYWHDLTCIIGIQNKNQDPGYIIDKLNTHKP